MDRLRVGVDVGRNYKAHLIRGGVWTNNMLQ
jgi:hypothetical protein